MAGLIPEDIIEQVRHANDIVDVIGNYVQLKKRGANYIALSPFQKEKTPSFNVNPQRQIFKCFSSGHGGDVFKFLMLMENMTYPEAIRRLAQRAGIVIPETNGGINAEQRSRREELLAVYAAIASYWQKLLHTDPAAEPARAYLKGREFPSSLAQEFGLGYAPEGWDTTMKWAQQAGYSMDLLEEGKLVSTSESGRRFDFFRGRLMIPIYDESGQVIAFSGRLLDPEAKAQKYVNSSETPIFTKGNVFFGLNKTKRAIIETGSAILCEGQIDLMRCWQKGVKNVVAPQGTAFTEQQARILKRLAKEVVVCFDADRAGQNAAQKVIDVLLKVDVQIRIARIPDGKDPDDFLRHNPAEAFQDIIAQAKDYTRHLLDAACAEEDVASPRGRGLVAQKMALVIAKIPNAVQRETFLLDVARRLQVSRAVLDEEVRKAESALRRAESMPRPMYETEPEPGEPGVIPAEAAPLEPLKPDKLIEGLMMLLLKNPHLVPEVSRQLNPVWLEGLTGAEVLSDLMESHAADAWHEADEYIRNSDDRTRDYLTGLFFDSSASMTNYLQEEDLNYQGGETGKLLNEVWERKNRSSKNVDQNTPETNVAQLVRNIDRRWKKQRLQFLMLATKSDELSVEERLKYLAEIQTIRRQFPDLEP